MELKEDDVVMCTVKKIEGTTVFVSIEENGEGSIVMSEIAAGRIRNLREYVSPEKKIVCKILKITKEHIELSLRRVTSKEKEEIKEKYEKERNLLSMLKASVKNPEETFKKIKETYGAQEFLDEARSNPAILEKTIPKSELDAFSRILAEKKEKEKVVKKSFTIKSFSPSGIKEIKEILQSAKGTEMSYLGSSKFSVSAKAKDFKEANTQVQNVIEQIKNKAREKKMVFESDEK